MPLPSFNQEEAVNGGPLLPDADEIGVGRAFGNGAFGTGLVGLGGIAEDVPECVPDSRTCTDEDDCAVPAGVISEGISISALHVSPEPL